MEDRVSERRWLLNIAPAYHTPMSKKAGRAINRRMRKLSRLLDKMTPWREKDKIERLKQKTKSDKGKAKKALEQSAALAKKFGLD